MILIDGRIENNRSVQELYPDMRRQIVKTLCQPMLHQEKVILACDRFSQKLDQGEYDSYLNGILTGAQKETVVDMLKKETLEEKMFTELGVDIRKKDEITDASRLIAPLGVLLHIAAGNMEGIPAYSVVEGLLAGNINILKLPSADQGITVNLLQELIRLEPELQEYIYVVDTPSVDIKSMKLLEKLSDAIVTWGSDAAVNAVRNMAAPNTRLIEWGHKLSFIYLTEAKIDSFDYQQLANHIAQSKQLLCNSCQGVFIDTTKNEVLEYFTKKLFPVLEDTLSCYEPAPIEVQAKITLQLYTEELKKVTERKRIKLYRGKHCSIQIESDSELTASYTHGNLWVKKLPKEQLVRKLHPYKSYLQTVGLECEDEEYRGLRDILVRAGLTRITDTLGMLAYKKNASHDGCYPLQRYTKIVEL